MTDKQNSVPTKLEDLGLIHSAWEPERNEDDAFVSDDDSDNFGGPRSTDVNRGAW